MDSDPLEGSGHGRGGSGGAARRSHAALGEIPVGTYLLEQEYLYAFATRALLAVSGTAQKDVISAPEPASVSAPG